MARSDNVAMADVALIRRIAETLYGDRPAVSLGQALGVNPRTVERWLAGQNAIPAGIWDQLPAVAAAREREIAELRRELEEGSKSDERSA